MGATLPMLTDALSRSNAELRRDGRQAVRLEYARRDARRDRHRNRARAFFGITSTGLIAMTLNLAAGVDGAALSAEPAAAAAAVAESRTPFTARDYRYLG